MVELKTKMTRVSPVLFLKGIADMEKRKDALALLQVFKKATGLPPKIWGTSIVGFGKYHYESERSTQKGDWPLTGFSPRKQNLTVYIMSGAKSYTLLLKSLGKFKVSGGSCIYIKKLSDIDTRVLTKIINQSVKDMRKKYSLI